MIFKILGAWLFIDGLGSISVHHVDKGKHRPRLKVIETIVRVVRATAGAALVVVG